MPEIIVSEMELLGVPAMTAGGYSRIAALVTYSPAHARDGIGDAIMVSLAKAREIAAAAGYRLSVAAEEKTLGENGYNDGAFDDNFGRNRRPWKKDSAMTWTDTTLLKPKGQKADYTKQEKGRTYLLRIVKEGGKVVGELWVPQDGLVREWSVFGIPSETVDENQHAKGSETHFSFDHDFDESGVCHGSDFRHERIGCFRLHADMVLGADVDEGFRLVKGPLPEYRKV